MPYASHAQSAYGTSTIRISCSLCMATFCVVVNRVGWILLLPRNKDSWLHPQHDGWPICGSPPSFSPLTALEAVGESQRSIDVRLLGLLGPYLQHVVSIFNTCSQVPTHKSLIDTYRGYNLGGVSFPHHSPRPSQPTLLHFPLMTPPGLHSSKLHKKLPISNCMVTYCRHVVFRPHDTLPLPTPMPSHR
jgi:hypothetical protein